MKVISVFVTTLLMVLALALYSMTQMTIQHLISCSSGDSQTLIPAQVCNLYMNNFRVTDSDLSSLSNSTGLEYILNGQNSIKYEIAELFIAKGLNVDGVNHYSEKKVTPLYASVIYADLEMTSFLLSHGANPLLINRQTNLSPYSLAIQLYQHSDNQQHLLLIAELERYIKK